MIPFSLGAAPELLGDADAMVVVTTWVIISVVVAMLRIV